VILFQNSDCQWGDRVSGTEAIRTRRFPRNSEDHVAEDKLVRVLDFIVAQPDLAKLGIGGVNPNEIGRPTYHLRCC
jgi:hypothetical protein